MQEKLDHVTSGEIKRLIFQAPPRHGKTEQNTVRYAGHRLERDPRTRIIIGAYNQTLADKFSRKIRRIGFARGLPINQERTAVHDWETIAGGGIRAVGVGGGLTGQGGNLILLDDPIKSRAEAESPVYRDRLWEWFTDDVWTRQEPDAAVVITMARWHHDDLIGRILASEDARSWTVVNLPALAEQDDVLGRPEGAALCPDRFDEEALASIREVQGEYAFGAIYQGRPTPRTGNMFPRGKVTSVPAAPAGTRWCRAWDKAGTAGAGKRSAGVKVGKGPDARWYIGDVVLGQWVAAERETVMKTTASTDGVAVEIELEQEPGSGGKESAESSIKGLAGYAVQARPSTGDKQTRAQPFAAQWQAGNVSVVAGPDPNAPAPWIHKYLEEMELAPYGKYVDQMDASAAGFNRLALHEVSFTPVRVRMG